MILSYALLTVNAKSHALMSRYQQSGNEKRMLAILNEGTADAWLSARPEKAPGVHAGLAGELADG